MVGKGLLAMASDFNKPVVGDAYASLLPALVGTLKDLARSLEPTLTGTSTNVPTGTTRWNAGSNYWERFNATAWVTLPSAGNNLYAFNISGNAATATSAGSATTAGGAATAGFATTAGSANNVTGLVAVANGGTGLTTIAPGALLVGNGTSAAGVATAAQIVAAISTTAVANATNATNATSSRAVTNSGGWGVVPSGSKLYFSYNGTNLGSLDSSGNFVAVGNITAFGAP